MRSEYEASLAGWGITDPDLEAVVGRVTEATETELWPDHEPTFRLFCGMCTQWRMGGAGPIGLDYAVIPTVARGVGLSPEDADAAFGDLQVMEDEALVLFDKRRSERSR